MPRRGIQPFSNQCFLQKGRFSNAATVCCSVQFLLKFAGAKKKRKKALIIWNMPIFKFEIAFFSSLLCKRDLQQTSCSVSKWNTSFNLKQNNALGFAFPWTFLKVFALGWPAVIFLLTSLSHQQTKQFPVCSAVVLWDGAAIQQSTWAPDLFHQFMLLLKVPFFLPQPSGLVAPSLPTVPVLAEPTH